MTNRQPTLIDLFAHNASARAGYAALISGDDVHTHATLYAVMQRQAAALAALGVHRGDRIVLVAGNRAEVVVLLGAAAWLGAMLVPLNLRLSPAEIVQQASDASPSLVVIDAACAPLWHAAWPDGMAGVQTVLLEDASGPALAIAGPATAGPVPREDAPGLGVVMLYTAAVQGHARGAVLAQSNLTSSARQIGQVWSLGQDDRWLGVLPLYHAAGIGLSLALLASGGACVLMPRFDPSTAAQAIEAHQITICSTFAPMLGALLDAAEANGASLASLRICMGLEPAATIERLTALSPGAGFWSAYGQAEVSSLVCLGLQRERPGAAGRAVPPSMIRVQDGAGRALAAGEQGEIAVRGPTVFLGYWDPKSRVPVKPSDTWHPTGDLGHMDDDGWLWFAGRAAHKQLIKTGGENVYPAEVEQVLLAHPAVTEAFVFGKPDARWGESVHAACSLAPGSQVTEADLIAFVEERVARYKRPRSITFSARPIDRTRPAG